MKQQHFERKNSALWKTLENFIILPAKKRAEKQKDLADFPKNYRQACMHLAIARDRHYSPALVERLENLTLQCHQMLYGSSGGKKIRLTRYFLNDFPALIRKEWKLVLFSSLLLLGVMVLMVYLVDQNPHISYMILGEKQIAMMEEMYDPAAEHIGRQRDAGSDVMMWGHYIKNNVGIDFTCFAAGAFFGIGSIICMFFNGFFIGTVAGHLTHIGYGGTFWPFVSGHSALELVAAVFAGVAGMKLGFSLLSPGNRKRIHAFKEEAITATKILYGTATMTFLAAFIEAFWSSRADIPADIKYWFGGIMWILVIVYFGCCGRNYEAK